MYSSIRQEPKAGRRAGRRGKRARRRHHAAAARLGWLSLSGQGKPGISKCHLRTCRGIGRASGIGGTSDLHTNPLLRLRTRAVNQGRSRRAVPPGWRLQANGRRRQRWCRPGSHPPCLQRVSCVVALPDTPHVVALLEQRHLVACKRVSGRAGLFADARASACRLWAATLWHTRHDPRCPALPFLACMSQLCGSLQAGNSSPDHCKLGARWDRHAVQRRKRDGWRRRQQVVDEGARGVFRSPHQG